MTKNLSRSVKYNFNLIFFRTQNDSVAINVANLFIGNYREKSGEHGYNKILATRKEYV